MFGGHGHSHEDGHGHSHDGGVHGHSHGTSEYNPNDNVGFGDEADDANKSSSHGNQKAAILHPNMMFMQMMANSMKSDLNSSDTSKNSENESMSRMPMMMLPTQMTPQMMEMAQKMFEQRQQLMKEYMEKGGSQNPAALQEMMAKAAQAQAQAMSQFKSLPSPSVNLSNANLTSGSNEINTQSRTNDTFIPSMPQLPNTNNDASSLLNANLNSSKLDELINKRNASYKKAKEEEEARILDSIAKKDYSQLNAVKATQYGVLERLKELVETGQCDPSKPDIENVYLLHWSAINNRQDIAKYLISIGCNVDPVGGELESTPLNWAARSGHAKMVSFLIHNGANPLLYDIEGFSTVHLATMFGHSIVVAYLLAKGIDPDLRDRNGVTPLMFAAQRIHSRDPAQLLITFNAHLNSQDSKGNTALHYSVAFNNATVMQVLLNKGASLDVKNLKGQDPIEFALDRKKMSAANFLRTFKSDEKESLPPFLKSISQNKETRKLFTRIYPFLLLFYFGFVLDMNINWLLKIIILAFFWIITFCFQKLFFDKNLTKHVPMATAASFITMLYLTWFIYFREFVFDFSLYSLTFIVATFFSWYNFYKSYKSDPGVLSGNREQMNKTIIQFVEQEEFSLENFCTSCIVRKPLRSKHCAECDRCIAKFDHHCPWVDNCIGQNNLKYFIGFLFWTPICLTFYMHGSIKFYQETCYRQDRLNNPEMTSFQLFYQFTTCSTWVTFFTFIAGFNLFWITCLLICHVYQGIFIALTTNERMNIARYKHFYDKNGNYHNPFNFGYVQNFIDLIDTKCCFLKPTLINWKKEHDIKDLLNSRLDKKKEKYEYQDV